jgi:integrase
VLFLYQQVLGCDPGWLDEIVRAKRPERLPVVLTRDEVQALLAALDGVPWIMAMLLYGVGLRLMECLRLRVKDIEFTRNEIVVREGKGNKDRVTMLPGAVKDPLQAHLRRVREVHARDVRAGCRCAGCAGGQVRECKPRVGLAVGVSSGADLSRPALR